MNSGFSVMKIGGEIFDRHVMLRYAADRSPGNASSSIAARVATRRSRSASKRVSSRMRPA